MPYSEDGINFDTIPPFSHKILIKRNLESICCIISPDKVDITGCYILYLSSYISSTLLLKIGKISYHLGYKQLYFNVPIGLKLDKLELFTHTHSDTIEDTYRLNLSIFSPYSPGTHYD